MKNNKILLAAAALLLGFASCNKDDVDPGNPVLEPLTTFTTAHFADSLVFSARVSDRVPLSTLKAQLFFNDEKVSETVIRTRTDGDYSGKIFIPYHANIPDGTATLKLVLQNINFTIAEKSYDLPVSRPDFPSLKLVMDDGTEKTMARVSKYNYEVVDEFDAKVRAYIVAPAYGTAGNDVTFGMSGGAITEGSTSYISFSAAQPGVFPITFNTLTYAAGPFVVVKINDRELTVVDENTSAVVLTISKGEEMRFEGFANIDEWWMDPSFFELDGEAYKFRAIDGTYKITANFALEYFRVEVTNAAGNAATLRPDGTGAVWAIGTDIGYPNLTNEVGWNTDKALCMAPIEATKYQLVFEATPKATAPEAGTINATGINFKFFHQRGWGGEFNGSAVISTTSDLITVGATDGNLSLTGGVPLEEGATYVFTLDVTGGSPQTAVLTVDKQ